jgi:hypothetical protein
MTNAQFAFALDNCGEIQKAYMIGTEDVHIVLRRLETLKVNIEDMKVGAGAACAAGSDKKNNREDDCCGDSIEPDDFRVLLSKKLGIPLNTISKHIDNSGVQYYIIKCSKKIFYRHVQSKKDRKCYTMFINGVGTGSVISLNLPNRYLGIDVDKELETLTVLFPERDRPCIVLIKGMPTPTFDETLQIWKPYTSTSTSKKNPRWMTCQ